MADCSRCKHQLLYSVIKVTESDTEDALVAMREGIYLDTLDGLQRLVPAGRYKLSYSALRDILVQENNAVFYFVGESDRQFFIALYPEYASWNL